MSNSPAGTTTISAQSGQSRKTSPGLGAAAVCAFDGRRRRKKTKQDRQKLQTPVHSHAQARVPLRARHDHRPDATGPRQSAHRSQNHANRAADRLSTAKSCCRLQFPVLRPKARSGKSEIFSTLPAFTSSGGRVSQRSSGAKRRRGRDRRQAAQLGLRRSLKGTIMSSELSNFRRRAKKCRFV